MNNALLVNTFLEKEIESEINEILRIDWLSDIIEVTYWYVTPEHNPEISYNVSLFNDFLKISYEDFFLRWLSYPGLKTAFLQKSNSIIQRFEMVIKQLNNCSEIDALKKELIINAIRYNINTIKLAQNGIDFELEKAWMKLHLSEEQIQEKLEINKELEKELFGWDILDSEEESVWSLRFIEKRFLLKWDTVLTTDEQERFQALINKLKWILEVKKYTYTSPTQEDLDKREEKDSFFEKYGDVKIPRDIYVHIFQEVINLSWLRQKVALSIPEDWFDNGMIKFIKIIFNNIEVRTTQKWSIYDWPDFLEFPFSYNSFLNLLSWNIDKIDDIEGLTNKEKESLLQHLHNESKVNNAKDSNPIKGFDQLPIERVLKLIAHEILWHYYNQRNHEKYFWNIRCLWNVEKEEGLAKFMEYTLLGRSITDDDIYEAPFSQLFACEVLSWDDFKEFLSIFTKISEAKISNELLFMRRKRNYSMHLAWAQHKDTTYTRWLKKISDFVQNGWDTKLLFNGKFWLDDLISKKVDFSSDDDFLLPIFVPDVIIFYILIEKWLLQTKFTHDNFVIFLQDKYKDSLPWIDFNSVKMVTFFQKRKLLMIINNFSNLLKEEVFE